MYDIQRRVAQPEQSWIRERPMILIHFWSNVGVQLCFDWLTNRSNQQLCYIGKFRDVCSFFRPSTLYQMRNCLFTALRAPLATRPRTNWVENVLGSRIQDVMGVVFEIFDARVISAVHMFWFSDGVILYVPYFDKSFSSVVDVPKVLRETSLKLHLPLLQYGGEIGMSAVPPLAGTWCAGDTRARLRQSGQQRSQIFHCKDRRWWWPDGALCTSADSPV